MNKPHRKILTNSHWGSKKLLVHLPAMIFHVPNGAAEDTAERNSKNAAKLVQVGVGAMEHVDPSIIHSYACSRPDGL